MDFFNALNKDVGFMVKGLDQREKRHSVLSANIANADTPGYKSIDVSFGKELEKAGLKMARTNPAHLGGTTNTEKDSIVLTGGLPRRDGNDVDIDAQMASLARNQIEYALLTKALGKRFQMLKEAIRGRQ